MSVDVDKLRRFEKAATEGPWEVLHCKEDILVAAPDETICGYTSGRFPCECLEEADAIFIVEMRNTMLDLVDEVERLRGALREIAEEDPCVEALELRRSARRLLDTK